MLPNGKHTVAEGFRFVKSAIAAASSWGNFSSDIPRGNGQSVIVYPGFLGTRISTLPIRYFLQDLDYAAIDWGMGQNCGPIAIGDKWERTVETAAREASRSGGKVLLVGISLGGVVAREVAREVPDLVAGVVTLGTPVKDGRSATGLWPLYKMLSGQVEDDPILQRVTAELNIPNVSIYSKTDGVVWWESSIASGRNSRNVEVNTSHLGMGVDPQSLRQIGLALGGFK